MQRTFLCMVLFLISFSTFSESILAGYDDGLFIVSKGYLIESIWQDVSIQKILKVPDGFFFLTKNGIFFSSDLKQFIPRNNGLPSKTLKLFDNQVKSFIQEITTLKDLECDPYNPKTLITCTKNEIYYSFDAGLTWAKKNSPSTDVTGLKAVAIVSKPLPLIYVSHPTRGVYSIEYNNPKAVWKDASKGIPLLGNSNVPQEVSDLCVSIESGKPFLYAGLSFKNQLLKTDCGITNFTTLLKPSELNGTCESLLASNGQLAYVNNDCVKMIQSSTLVITDAAEITQTIKTLSLLRQNQLNTICYEFDKSNSQCFNELWLVSQKKMSSNLEKANNRVGMYLVTDFMLNAKYRLTYENIMQEKGVNSLVIDMKDDTGCLRFTPQSVLLKTIGKTSRPLDIEPFVKEMKEKNIYLIARIVVFKDQVVHQYSSGKYAAWDYTTKAPWHAYESIIENKVTVKKPSAEYWTDPYCEFVWQYNVEIAKEIIARGFDEVQFDYIRFPTDGENLYNASYRFKEQNMDKDSAIVSFLSYARKNISAPISIDIYGANGFYRTGARTGQDVEMIAPLVDVICPMYYPSHFEQGFLAQKPIENRPYRIFYEGSYRTWVMARSCILVRSYVQAFYYNAASYDRTYYNNDYVKKEVDGIRESVNTGLIYWNNSGRYDDIPYLTYNEKNKLETVTTPENKKK